jgi:hypothetical protein
VLCRQDYSFLGRKKVGPIVYLRNLIVYLYSNIVLKEDEAILERFQRGQKTLTYSEHYIHELEVAVAHINKEITKALNTDSFSAEK